GGGAGPADRHAHTVYRGDLRLRQAARTELGARAAAGRLVHVSGRCFLVPTMDDRRRTMRLSSTIYRPRNQISISAMLYSSYNSTFHEPRRRGAHGDGR